MGNITLLHFICLVLKVWLQVSYCGELTPLHQYHLMMFFLHEHWITHFVGFANLASWNISVSFVLHKRTFAWDVHHSWTWVLFFDAISCGGYYANWSMRSMNLVVLFSRATHPETTWRHLQGSWEYCITLLSRDESPPTSIFMDTLETTINLSLHNLAFSTEANFCE